MTKVRAPLTPERAMTKVADLLGWDGAAGIVGKSDRTVRDWSDPDSPRVISFTDAVKLDVAFRVAGGEGAPFFQCYATQLETSVAEALADRTALSMRLATAAQEGGEALSHGIRAALPGATPEQLARAALELEEAVASHQNALAAVRALQAAAGSQDATRAPEVAPPAPIAAPATP